MNSASQIRTPHARISVERRRRDRTPRSPLMITLRQAAREDCARIARLFMIASDGLAEYIWSQVGAPGLSLLEIGEHRYAREDTAFSYQNCLVAEKDGNVIGMLHAFPMRQPPGDGQHRYIDPVLAPYAELEDYGSFYISAVATFNEYRGLGIGTRLLEEGRRRARTLGLDRLSLICFEKNTGALRLYRRLGFRQLERRSVVPHPFLHYREGDAILLACPIDEFTTT